MAGIGFRLQKLLTGESYADLIKAYLYSALISTGPMLVVIIALTGVKTFTQYRLSIEEGGLLLGIIVYVYAYSMLGVSPFLYVVTRHIADRYYFRDLQLFSPIYLSVLQIVLVIQSIVALVFLWNFPVSTGAKWAIFCLYLFVNGTWIAMLFISAAQNYMSIVVAFVAGSLITLVAAYGLGLRHGFDGFLYGYTIGQGVIFFILTGRIFHEFGFTKEQDFGFLGYFRKHIYLLFVGIFYYLGVWIDKFLFWYSDEGVELAHGIFISPNYDTPLFLAYLTIVPSMAFFLIQMETSFVHVYHDYYRVVRSRGSLYEVEAKKEVLMQNLAANFQKFVIFQGIISGLVIVYVYEIANLFSLNPFQMGIFRIAILGAFMQMGFIMVLNILFYFDFKKDACLLTLVYLACNIVFTKISLAIGLTAYGFGYTLAGFVALLVAFLVMDAKLRQLDYWTFMRQPVLIPKFKLEAETRRRGQV